MSQGLISKFTKSRLMPTPAASKTALERKRCKRYASDFVIWLDVLLLVLGAMTAAVIIRLAEMTP